MVLLYFVVYYNANRVCASVFVHTRRHLRHLRHPRQRLLYTRKITTLNAARVSNQNQPFVIMAYFSLALSFLIVPSLANSAIIYPWWTPICPVNAKPVQPEQCLFSNELIEHWGYPSETHVAVTTDGYKLTLFRIPHGKTGSKSDRRPVVFLQHGLLDSSDCWLINLPNQSLAYVLADSGYDVWLGNIRGNRYSRDNMDIRPTSKSFWNFSWEHHAEIDLPTMVEFVLGYTGAQKLDYVAHSQGTLMGFVKFGTDPEWAKQKIRAFYALAPIWFLGHIRINPFRELVQPWTISALESLFNFFHVYEFGTSKGVSEKLAELFCINELKLDKLICNNVVDLVLGYNNAYINNTRLPTILAHEGDAGSSIKNIVHYGQMIATNTVSKFDYGKSINIKTYGQPTPPQYHLTDLATPTVLFTGGKDILADSTDIKSLIPLISDVIEGQYFFANFNHVDYVVGLGSYMVNDIVVKMLGQGV